MIDALPLLLGPEGYNIERSVRLRSSASAYFNRTPASAGNRKTWTWSGWVKRGALGTSQVLFIGYVDANNKTRIDISSTDTLRVYDITGGATERVRVYTTQVFRDPSAWYHIVVAMDTTQATASDRVKVYVNGSQVTAFGTASYPSQNTDLYINATNAHALGGSPPDSQYFDGYLTEVNFIDGQALTPASFGETDAVTGVWKPKKYAGTYGTNGFYLNFSDNSAATAAAIGKDYSGNGNNWTPNNISVTAGVTYDSMLDVPTQWADGGNGRGNYAVWNLLLKNVTNPPAVVDGNLYISTTPATNYGVTLATIGVSTGKWYWEVTPNSVTGGVMVGVANSSIDLTKFLGNETNGWGYYSSGNKYNNSAAGVAYGASFTTNDVIGVALDMDAGTITFYKNNTSQGEAFSGLTGTLFPAVSDGSNSSASSIYGNFGQRPFAFSPPTGFRALNTLNLPEPTILKGNQYFDVSLWTGNGTTPRQVVSGLGFQPDLIWTKPRSAATNHTLYDSVRGVGSGKALSSALTDAEGLAASSNQDATYGYLSSINADGFTATQGSSGFQYFNTNATTYVGWQWKEGATQGFDIVTGTGPASGAFTVNHSLGVAPAMIVMKDRTTAGTNWVVYHKNMNASPQAYFMQLNSTIAATNNTSVWNNTAPTSTSFQSVANSIINPSAGYVAYLFSEVAGFSKFGKYTGNGSADGPFIFTGFRPRFVMVKRIDLTNDWFTVDSSRNTYNIASALLRPNTSAAEQTSGVIDVLSNGFKPRTTDSAYNASGGTYIFAAFSEVGFKFSLAR